MCSRMAVPFTALVYVRITAGGHSTRTLYSSTANKPREAARGVVDIIP